MRYGLEIGESAIEQLRALPKDLRRNIGRRIEQMCDDLQGDVKKLKARKSHYRLRVGDHRVLFRLAEGVIEVYAVKDRKDAYE
jgi:mRNA-degrading endonuclease RelE of RelBE toxin-antitoxin system